MKKIEKKTWPELFEKILSGEKTFDVRIADFKIMPGNTIIFREWNPKTKKYTGRIVEKKVTYILKTKGVRFWKKEDIKKYGLQIIAFKKRG